MKGNSIFQIIRSNLNISKVYSSNYRYSISILKKQLPSISRGFSSGEYESKYSEKEKNNILNILNESDQDKLKLYAVSQGRLKKIIEYRQNNRKFNNLSDVLGIEGLGVKFLEKFCDSIVQTDVENDTNEPDEVTMEPLRKMKGQLLSPILTPKKCAVINSVTAFHISVNSVSWCSINRSDYTLTDWKIVDTCVDEGKRIQLTDIMHGAWSVIEAMPQTDVYVSESPPSTLRAGGSDPNNPKIITINLQRAQLSAMLIALLNVKNYQFNRETDKDTEEKLSQSVYLLRSALPARLFRLVIGSEVVSVSSTLQKIFSSQNDPQDGSTVRIGNDHCQYYFKQKDTNREMLGRALLLGITFVDVCLNKNQKSIDSINSYSRRVT